MGMHEVAPLVFQQPTAFIDRTHLPQDGVYVVEAEEQGHWG